MAHPIHDADEFSPYGTQTKQDLYTRHNVSHSETFFTNSQNLSIFTQTWQPSSSKLKGLIAMIHGYTGESGWLSELNAVAFAKSGFFVCALDLQGHGRSQGPSDHITDIHLLIKDCATYFDSARNRHPNIPHFLYGESLGGAIAIMLCLEQQDQWKGLILSGSMCTISKKFRLWPLDKLVKIAAFFAPSWRISIIKPPGSLSYREEWKTRLARRSPHRRSCGKPTPATTVEIFKVCDYIKAKCEEIRVPLLVFHGERDAVCDPEGAKYVYKMAGSRDKTLMIFPGMWHLMIGEDNRRVEEIFEIILSWIRQRADSAKTL